MAYSQTHTAMETFSLNSRRPALLAAVLSVVPVIVGNRRGVGVSWDSTDYIAVGLSMAEGRGALDVTGQPMVIRPPGLSAFVTLGEWLSVSPSVTLTVVNTISMMIVVWCTYRLLDRAGVGTFATWTSVALVALSPALLDIFTMAWSEPPFLALTLLALLIATRDRSWPWEFALAGLFTAMFFVRYVGPFYATPISLVAAVAQVRRSGWVLSLLRAGTSLCVSMVLPWLWLMRNKDLTGYLTGYREPGGGTLLDPLKTFTGTLGSWLIARPPLNGDGGIYLTWSDFSAYMQVAGVLMWLLIVGSVVAFFVSKRRRRDENIVLGSSLLVFLFYGGFSVYRFVYDEMGPLDSRMMSGLYVPVILIVAIALSHVTTGHLPSSHMFVRGLAALASIVVVWHGATTVTDSWQYGSQGRRWSAVDHQVAPIHLFARALPRNSTLFSNEPQSLFAATTSWPIRNQYLRDLPTLVPCEQRYFIWYNQTFLPDGKPVGAEILFEDLSGQVLDLGSCDSDINQFWP